MANKTGIERTYKHKCGKILVGTTNKKDCKAAYVTLETYIIPEGFLSESIDKIRRRIKAKMRLFGPTYFEDKYKSYLINIDYNQTKDIPGKKSFIAIEITLLANNTFNFNPDFVFNCYSFADTLFCLLETLSEDFSMSTSLK
jgi:hypothetical protein